MDVYICTDCKTIVTTYIPIEDKECPRCKKVTLKKDDDIGYDPSFYHQQDVFHPTVSC